MLPVFPPSLDSQPESNWNSIEEIQLALDQLRRQMLRLEQREQQLLQALALASRSRVKELVDDGGVSAPALEVLLQRAVDSSRRGRIEAPPSQGPSAIQVRKAPLRFRHPDDPGVVWSGRGKTPRWILDLQAQGRLDQARIPADDF